MIRSTTGALRAQLIASAAIGAIASASAAQAADAPAVVATASDVAAASDAATASDADTATAVSAVVITYANVTRSAVSMSGGEAQKVLPGVNPLRAIESLPGVIFETADPWGNDEQNEYLWVHGFTTEQLGYTLDNVPLGDGAYGNYDGLSPVRAVISEDVSRVELSTGAGALGVASTSNLGGAIETFSRDPSKTLGADVRQTFGSYQALRTFARIDTGEFAGGNSAYFAYAHQSAKAWDFDGYQGGDQFNAKFVHDGAHGKLTAYLDVSSKTDPNEDAVDFGNLQTAAAQGFIPYTRPYQYPNLAQEIASLSPSAANGFLPGTPPTAQGNNFSNYHSAEQRNDVLGYVKYDYQITSNIDWSNQAYYHYDYGRGIVAGPVNTAGLPALFAVYFPQLVVNKSTSSAATLQNIVNQFGGDGLAVRTTEYHINREGEISTLTWHAGQHDIEAGLWYEHNESGQHRVWYPFSAANDDLTPYDIPRHSAFTQDAVDFHTDDIQFHLQDQWRVLPTLRLQAGFKSSLQTAGNQVLIQQLNGDFPTGSITTNEWFLPQFGAVWDATSNDQLFANIQENIREFIPYSQGINFYSASPWNLANQAAFNLFKSTVHPEQDWTYEIGLRSHHTLDMGALTDFEGQLSFYHVDFSNRILNVAPFNFINPAASILVNVGGVTTNGFDTAATFSFGPHFQVYNALSYDSTLYDSNYDSGTAAGGAPIVVPVKGKWVPGVPDWANKTVLSTNFGPFEAQINGDYVGKRYATPVNDLSVPPTFLVGLEASYQIPVAANAALKTARISVNATNIANARGVSSVVPAATSGGYTAFPIAPTEVFVTLQGTF
jgi:outer membrane receptor protein involved in Fe transport